MSNLYSERQQDALLEIVEQVEAIETEIAGRNKDKAEAYKTAKDFAIEPTHIRAFVAERRRRLRNEEAADRIDMAMAEMATAVEAAKRRRGRPTPDSPLISPTAHASPGAGHSADFLAHTRVHVHPREPPDHDAETGEIIEPGTQSDLSAPPADSASMPLATGGGSQPPSLPPPEPDGLDLPSFLDRRAG